MMALLPLPCSMKLKSLHTTSLINVRSGKLSRVEASATATRTDTSYQLNNSFQLTTFNDAAYGPIFKGLPPVLSQISIPKFDETVLDEEVDGIVERLRIAVDKVVDIETKKFMCRVKAEALSQEDSLLVDEMRSEISRQYFEKPIRYLKSGCATFEQKIKDLSFLIKMLQEISST